MTICQNQRKKIDKSNPQEIPMLTCGITGELCICQYWCEKQHCYRVVDHVENLCKYFKPL